MTPIEILRNRAKELMTTEVEFIDSIKVKLSTEKKYGWGKGQRVGKYNPLTKTIILYDSFSRLPGSPETAADEIFPTYMHELIHAIQHRNMGTLVYLLTLVLCRPLFEQGCRETENNLYKN